MTCSDERQTERSIRSEPQSPDRRMLVLGPQVQARFWPAMATAAIRASAKAERLLCGRRSFLEQAEYHFYSALARAASCDSASADERQAHVGRPGRAPATARSLGADMRRRTSRIEPRWWERRSPE